MIQTIAFYLFAILVIASAYMYIRSRRQKVDHSNVNAEWSDETAPATAGQAAA